MDISNIKSGIIHLTIGTTQQIYWLFKDQEVTYSYLYHARTSEIRRELEYADPFLDTTKVVIIYPKSFKGSGYIKPIKRATKSTKKSNTSVSDDYELPSDQFLKIPPTTYCFVICVDALGVYTDSAAASIKKLQGYPYSDSLLDLRTYEPLKLEDDAIDERTKEFYRMYPNDLYEKVSKGLELEIIETSQIKEEKEIVHGLLDKNKLDRWGRFHRSEMFRFFFNYNYNDIPILANARAWCLTPYLKPVLTHIQHKGNLSNPSAYLYRFALWVNWSTTYWAEPGARGLYYYKKDVNKETFITYGFEASAEAKRRWPSIIQEPKLLRKRV